MNDARNTSSQGDKVGIVLVNYNGGRFLPDCLRSVAANDYPNTLVVLVDNASSDGSPEWVAKHYPDVSLIVRDTNGGFTGGCNEGIAWCRRSGCGFILLLNNDTVVEPDFLSRLMEHAAPKCLLSPKIYFYDDRQRINNHLGSYDFWRGLNRDLFYGRLDSDASRRIQTVTMASGCALLISADVIEENGGLDDAYFMYAEDNDFIVRAVKSGAVIKFIPASVIYHRESSSSGGVGSPLTVYYTNRNRLYFMFKYQKNPFARAFFVLYFALTRLVVAAKYLLRGQPAQLRALIHAITDYCRGRMGYAMPARYQ